MWFLIKFTSLCVLLVVASAATAHNPMKRIVGGTEVQRGEARFLASLWLLVPNSFTKHTGLHHFCGGTLIKRRWVLTSAHCFTYRYGVSEIYTRGLNHIRRWRIVLGEHDQNLTEIFERNFTIQRIYYHSSGNVALLKLNRRARFNRYTRKIPLDRMNTCPGIGQTCTLYGWGQTTEEPYGYGTRLPFKVGLKIQNLTMCQEAHREVPEIQLSDEEICAQNSKRGACDGDFGGPLVCWCAGKNVLSGVFLGAVGCARPGFAGVYANVSSLVEWIDAITRNY